MAIVIGILIGLVVGGALAAVALAFTGGTRLAAARRTRQLLIQEARREADQAAGPDGAPGWSEPGGGPGGAMVR